MFDREPKITKIRICMLIYNYDELHYYFKKYIFIFIIVDMKRKVRVYW